MQLLCKYSVFLFMLWGNAMVLPIFTKTICGYSDTSYGLATMVGAVLSVFITLLAGKSYDKFGIKPMFCVGTGMFAVFSVLGLLFSTGTSILRIALVHACQSVAMAALISPSTTMALSGLSGQERVDGSAIYNTLRQISSSLASTMSVLIFTLAGSNISAVHVVYSYFLLVTVMIALLVILYFRSEKVSLAQNNRSRA